MMNNVTHHNQCLYCGKTYGAIDAGFSIEGLYEAINDGYLKYHWTCENCYHENYFKKKADPKKCAELIRFFSRTNPEIFK